MGGNLEQQPHPLRGAKRVLHMFVGLEGMDVEQWPLQGGLRDPHSQRIKAGD